MVATDATTSNVRPKSRAIPSSQTDRTPCCRAVARPSTAAYRSIATTWGTMPRILRRPHGSTPILLPCAAAAEGS